MNIEDIKAVVDAALERQSKELQDCLFCGVAPNTRRLDHDFEGRTEVYDCTNDNCSIQPETTASEKSYQSWNRRPAQEQADTALIALWDICEVLKSELESDYNSFCEEEFNAGGR